MTDGSAMRMINNTVALTKVAAAWLPVIAMCVSAAALAQPVQTAMPALNADFGAVGLIGEMNSAEHYGALQSRLGAYNATGSGDARIDTLVVPLNAIVSLDQGGRWFAKVGTVYVRSDGAYPGDDQRDSTSQNFLLQMLHRPAAGTLIGLGFMPDKVEISIPANSADVDAQGAGVRLDLLQRLGSSSGLSAKVIYLDGHSTFNKRLPGGATASSRSSTTRTYVEATLITIIDSAKLSFVPQGWSLRPVTHVLFQRDSDRTQQGLASSEDFAQWLLTARIQKDVFRPGQLGPYVELGIEQELVNDIAADGNSDLLLYGKVGAAYLTGSWGRLDAYYARRQAPDDDFASNTLNVLFSMMF